MEFTVSRQDLLAELQAMSGIVEKKSTIPILANILLTAGKDRLELAATDLEVGIRSSCDARVAQAGSITVSARRLMDIVRYLPEADVRVRLEEGKGTWLLLTCAKARFRLVGLAPQDFPAIPEFDFGRAVPIERALLLDLVNKVIFAISTDETRTGINGTLTLLSKKFLTLVATDGHRLALVGGRLEKGSSEGKIEVVVPRKALQELLRIGEGEEEVLFGQKDNHVFFKVGRRVMTSTIVPAKFPDYEKVIPEGNDRMIRLEAPAFADVLRRVALLSSERSRAVRFAIKPGAVEISSSNPEVGEASESIDVDYSGPALEVGFNARYLLDFLQAVGQGPVIFALKDGDTQGLLRPVGMEGRDYRYVVMPMRL